VVTCRVPSGSITKVQPRAKLFTRKPEARIEHTIDH